MTGRDLIKYRTKLHLKNLFGSMNSLWPPRLYRAFLSHGQSGARQYPVLLDYQEFLRRSIPVSLALPGSGRCHPSRALDLGCGDRLKNPFLADILHGIDFGSNPVLNVVGVNLSIQPIPFKASYFTFVSAFDFIEHIPRVLCVGDATRNPFVDLMSEIYRVLKPGGLFLSVTPAFPSKIAFSDPTHVNIITEDTFPQYFCGSSPGAKPYGFTGSFNLLSQAWIRDIWIATLMQKPSSH